MSINLHATAKADPNEGPKGGSLSYSSLLSELTILTRVSSYTSAYIHVTIFHHLEDKKGREHESQTTTWLPYSALD